MLNGSRSYYFAFQGRVAKKHLKSDSLEGPSEIEKIWHKVGKMDPMIFRPEITYGMLRIMI